jgi:hypothetical protein
MFKFLRKSDLISIDQGTWYYFSADLSFAGFASFNFVRYIDVNSDRKAAIVQFLDKDYFSTKDLLLLPYTRESIYFRARLDRTLLVWAFDASRLGGANTVDLKSNWPKNILDKAVVTPSIEIARRSTNSW